MFNYNKLKTSALIALGGILISIIPVISSNMIDVINKGVQFDWKTPTVLTIGATSTWLVASLRNYITNK